LTFEIFNSYLEVKGKVQISKPLKNRFFNLMQVAGVSTAGIAL